MSTNLASAATGSRRDRERREFSRECVDFFAETVQVFGVPKSVGQIYGLLFASAEPLSFSNIVEQLTISKGSASQGLQLLRSLGAIHDAGAIKDAERRRREASDGASRRVTYVPELRLRRLVSGVLGERVAPLATGGQERLARLRTLAEREGSDFCLDRVKQLETWRRRSKAVLPVLSALFGPKSGK